jgi:hypothetical protein
MVGWLLTLGIFGIKIVEFQLELNVDQSPVHGRKLDAKFMLDLPQPLTFGRKLGHVIFVIHARSSKWRPPPDTTRRQGQGQ